MKKSAFLPSSSSSSWCQTRGSDAGFFASMLRRIFSCSNSLPTPRTSMDEDRFHVVSAPCIVARLMGLDSLPVPPADSFSSLEAGTQGSLNTYGSFREEEPSYVELRDEHFFILSFEKKEPKLMNQGAWKVYGKLNPNEDSQESKGRRRKKKKKKKKFEVDDEEGEAASPVSILAMDEFTTTSSDLSTPVNETEDSNNNLKESKPKNFKPWLDQIIRPLHKGRKPNSKSRNMWKEVGRISEEEMAKSRWDYGEDSKLQEFTEIDDHIADTLLKELLEEMNYINLEFE